MPIEIICGDLFAATAPVVLLNADVRVGADALGGANLAAKFRQRWPEAWEDVEAAVMSELERTSVGHVPLGEVFIAAVDDPDCRFSHVFLANSLPHVGASSDRTTAVTRAVERALLLAREIDIERIATPLMVGGWRLSPNAAFEGMVVGFRNAIQRTRPSPLGVSLLIHNLDASVCEELRARLVN